MLAPRIRSPRGSATRLGVSRAARNAPPGSCCTVGQTSAWVGSRWTPGARSRTPPFGRLNQSLDPIGVLHPGDPALLNAARKTTPPTAHPPAPPQACRFTLKPVSRKTGSVCVPVTGGPTGTAHGPHGGDGGQRPAYAAAGRRDQRQQQRSCRRRRVASSGVDPSMRADPGPWSYCRGWLIH